MDFFVPFFKYPIVKEFTKIKSWRVIDPPEAIRTGDLLLFSASGFLSSTIKLFSASRWNHVGMAVWCELIDYQNRTSIDLFCFEAGSQPFTDLMTRKYVDQGVRLVRFSDIAGMYDLVYHRGLTVHRDDTWAQRFENFMLRWKGVPFMKSYVTLAWSFLVTPATVRRQVTCSMLTAHMFNEMGVYPIRVNPKAFPEEVFTGPEKLIWTDNRWINARLVFSIIILITLIIIVIMLVLEVMKKISSNKVGSVNRKISKSSSVS
jgi:hypothetical protein